MTIFWLHVASTWFMVGLIWLIQLVHYPLFLNVGSKEFRKFHNNHTLFITPLVGSVMIIELVTLVILIFQTPHGIPNWIVIVGILLLSVIWLSTLIFQIPYHNKLSSNFDDNLIKMLIKTNWIRTICWSLRGILVLIMLNKLIENNS